MPTCNLAEIVLKIWLEQLRKHGTCLFIATFDDYVWTFKQSTFYKQYLQGGPSGHGPNKNELLLRRAQVSHELIWLVATIENYRDGSSFMIHILHLEGEKVFVWPSVALIVLMGHMVIPIDQTMWIFLICEWPRPLLVLIMFKMSPPTQGLSLHITFFQYSLEVGWS
jgi:hypothetical protein